MTWHLHCPHEPLPPHAEERYTFCSARVESSDAPCGTDSFFSPFMVMLTFPLGVRYFFATSRRITMRIITPQNTPMLDVMNIIIVCDILLILVFCTIFYIFSPEKHMNAIAISPTVMKVIPSPCKFFGTSE